MRSQTHLRSLLLTLALAILTYCFVLDSRFAPEVGQYLFVNEYLIHPPSAVAKTSPDAC
jgi:hypothetical protein